LNQPSDNQKDQKWYEGHEYFHALDVVAFFTIGKQKKSKMTWMSVSGTQT